MLMVMDPQQQSHNPYGFIMDADHKPKKSLIPTGGSPKNKIIFAFVGIVFLLVLYMIVSKIFFSNGDVDLALIRVRAQQVEIARVASLGVTNGTSSTTRNYSQTVLSSVSSEGTATGKLMTRAGIKVKPATLAGRKDPSTDVKLKTAIDNNNYDDVLLKTLKAELETYKNDLSQAYNKVSANNAKVLLKGANSNTLVLLQ